MNHADNTLGLYLSVPFCKAKCSFCNFASSVYPGSQLTAYIDRLCSEIRAAQTSSMESEATLPRVVDSIYLGGGTPSLMQPNQVRQMFNEIRSNFAVTAGAEVTVECAPGQLEQVTLEAFQREGVNRLSFGVQSFVDQECSAVGRLHTGAQCLDDLQRMKAAGIDRLSIDLIAGLPLQTEASWRYTIEQAILSGVEHVSIYMLEVDEGSRLGREALRGGLRYFAPALPEDDRIADWYGLACEWLQATGIRQYEISNFARPGSHSRHNCKYWRRRPYLGFGLDAHSMLRGPVSDLRWANSSGMNEYMGSLGSRGFVRTIDRIDRVAAFEEAVFLGLRMVEGIDLLALKEEFGPSCGSALYSPIPELIDAGMLVGRGERISLTPHGRTVSNEVFERLLVAEKLSAVS